MNIIYCREHTPNKVVAAGQCMLPAKHTDGGVVHTDIGEISVSNDPQGGAETPTAYLSRLESTYQAQFT